MNINCVICSDVLTPTAEVFVTKCGHMFHYTCLVNWLERKKTCPHCRNPVTEKNILRVYFNVADVYGVPEDVGTLINKIDNLQFQITLNQKDLKTHKAKSKNLSEVNGELRKEIAKLEDNLRTYESTIHALKDQISYFKSKSRETDRLNSEIVRLKQNLKDSQNVKLAIDGTREQVDEMLRNENDCESLAVLAAMLKKSLVDLERKKRELEISNKRLQNDTSKLKRELSDTQSQNMDLKRELTNIKVNFEKEKKFLKNKITDLNKRIPTRESSDNNSLDCIVLESPVNFNRTISNRVSSKLQSGDSSLDCIVLNSPVNFNRTISKKEESKPQPDEHAVNNTKANSPYLPLKSNPVSMELSSSRFNIGLINAPSKHEFTIFKSGNYKIDDNKKIVKSKLEVYDGLGGSSKDDIFPSPKPAKISLKRPKSSVPLTSNKLKKLAPLDKGKANDLFSQH